MSRPNRGRPPSQVAALALGSVLRIVLFTQFWTAVFTRGVDPVTGGPLDEGPALGALIVVGLIEVTLLGLTWYRPDGAASGVMVVLSVITAIGSANEGQPVVAAGYGVAALSFLVAPWLGRRARGRAPEAP